jgi:hypothetical protein
MSAEATCRATEIADFASSIEPWRERWLYAAERVGPTFWGSSRSPSRALHAAATMLGESPDLVRSRINAVRRFGFEGAREHVRRLNPSRDLGMCPLDRRLVGHVYFARSVDHSHVVKIGFSTQIETRISRVAALYGTQLAVFRTVVGTRIDEQWWHRDWQFHRIAHEWFFDPHSSCRIVPDFLKRDRLPLRRPGANGTAAMPIAFRPRIVGQPGPVPGAAEVRA